MTKYTLKGLEIKSFTDKIVLRTIEHDQKNNPVQMNLAIQFINDYQSRETSLLRITQQATELSRLYNIPITE